MKKQFISLVTMSFFGVGCIVAQQQDVRQIESRYFKNLFQINDSIFRSEQPSKKGFRELEAMGIKTIINLRRLKDDNRKAKGTGLQLKKVPLRSAKMVETDIANVLGLIHASEKPVLIHCWHGSDRTGVIIAAYRVVFENWDKERAIQEFRRKEFGYHENWYPNLLDLIRNLNPEKMREELGMD
nr:dual specificity protein phosphatase family protein [Allomuricauda sp.]